MSAKTAVDLSPVTAGASRDIITKPLERVVGSMTRSNPSRTDTKSEIQPGSELVEVGLERWMGIGLSV